ncbi:MAG: cbb3-type cytochrome c oxidase subunit 3 [Bacteroidales bacterium]|nr:cbb3-type cytochrome c oxidase subunit 3 [Bacteroidales bacterium]MCF8404544.1 cbb3-type cytochrome c oxidase subunit 3 [Bacteroidales bacterium]
MSKIIKSILENVSWLDEFSSVLTVFFALFFIVIVVGVLRWKKEKVEEYKNLPFSKNDSDIIN